MCKLLTLICWLAVTSLHAQLKEQIDALVKPYAASNNFSGTVYVARDGQVLYEESFGLAVREWNIPVSRETVFHLASVSKPLTATAILMLEERGKLGLQDPVSKYFPKFRDGSTITVHHLLTHTSGITNINNLPGYDKLALSTLTLDSIIGVFSSMPLRFKPGSKYEYSNSNYNLLARIIEKVSGMPFGEFLSKEIFQKLGMTATQHHGDPRVIIDHLATGYMESGRSDVVRAPYLDWNIKTGNGSLVSTAGDLARFDRALYTNKLLSEKSRIIMFTPFLNETGYGWFLRSDGEVKRTYINGRSPGFSAAFFRYPEEKLCIIVLSNMYVPVASEIANSIAGLIFRKSPPTRMLIDLPLPPTTTSRYTGKYRFGSDFFRPNTVVEIRVREGRLETDFGDLLHDHDDTFILRSFWSEIKFQREGDKVTGLTFDGTRAVREN